MSSLSETVKYPISMTVISVGMGTILLAFLLDLVLTESIVAGLLGIWGVIIATIGVFAVVVIWLIGMLGY